MKSENLFFTVKRRKIIFLFERWFFLRNTLFDASLLCSPIKCIERHSKWYRSLALMSKSTKCIEKVHHCVEKSFKKSHCEQSKQLFIFLFNRWHFTFFMQWSPCWVSKLTFLLRKYQRFSSLLNNVFTAYKRENDNWWAKNSKLRIRTQIT